MVAAPMRPIHRSRPIQIGLIVVVVAMGALGFVPLFGGPGYESSLGAGVILAFAVSITVALAGSADPAPPIDALYRGLATGGLLALAAWATTLVHGGGGGLWGGLSGS